MILIVEDSVGSIDLSGHPTLRSFPVRKVRTNLWLDDCPLLRSLPDTLVVGRLLSLSVCPSLSRLPTTLQVGGNLWLMSTPVTELPEGLEVGSYLYLAGSKVTHVPKSARIGGRVLGGLGKP